MLILVGSVPTCFVASNLYKKETKSSDPPLCGVILHSALYSGIFYLNHSEVGSSFPCGFLLYGRDPYNNVKWIPNIKVLPAFCVLISALFSISMESKMIRSPSHWD